MSIRFQTLRDTRAINDAFIGPVGQVTVDTDTRSLRLHDAVTAGGFRVAGAVLVDRFLTGTVKNVVIKGGETLVISNSSTAGAKTINLEAASPANDGCKVIIAAVRGNSDSHTVAGISGTVGGAANFVFTDDPATLTVISDGTRADWIIT